MAEEKKTPAKVEESKLTKVLNWFKTLPGRIAKPFKNMVAELRKVTWPSKKKLISSCVIVLLFMLIIGAVIAVLDLGSRAAVDGLYDVTHNPRLSSLSPTRTRSRVLPRLMMTPTSAMTPTLAMTRRMALL